MKHKYIVLNKYGRVHAIAMSVPQISMGLNIPLTNVYTALNTGKPLAGEYLILLRSKHEYLWHKHGALKGGDDYFAFCTPEELKWYKDNEKKAV